MKILDWEIGTQVWDDQLVQGLDHIALEGFKPACPVSILKYSRLYKEYQLKRSLKIIESLEGEVRAFTRIQTNLDKLGHKISTLPPPSL